MAAHSRLIRIKQQCAERSSKILHSSSPMSVDELKAKGNALFSAGNYDEAIGWFTKAIDAASALSSHASRVCNSVAWTAHNFLSVTRL